VEEAVSVKPRNTLILIAVFAVLFGYVWFVERPKTPEQLGTPTPPQPSVFDLKAQNVKSIEIHDLQKPRQVTVTRSGSGWQVEQPVAKGADATTVDDAVNKLVTLKATRVLTNTSLFSQYFITPTIEARLIMSDTTAYAITVGDKTPDGSDYYVSYTGDKSKVFIVSTVDLDTLTAWLDTPPYEPTPTPTFTPTVPPTATPPVTETITPTQTTAPPGIVPTLVPAPPTPTP
jgi:Domain of unknown function (DUF4340)